MVWLKFERSDNGKYEIKAIWNSAIYAKKSKDQLLSLYYLVL